MNYTEINEDPNSPQFGMPINPVPDPQPVKKNEPMGVDDLYNLTKYEPSKDQDNMEYRKDIADLELDRVAGVKGGFEPSPDETFGGTIKRAALTGMNWVVDGLDYANNISRSMIYAAMEGQDVARAGKQALTYKKRVYAADIKKSLAHKLGVESLSFGEDDGEFDPGDVADFFVDAAIDMATDPLTFVSLGTTKIIKGVGKKLSSQVIESSEKKFSRELLGQVESEQIKRGAKGYKQNGARVSYNLDKLKDNPEATRKVAKEMGLIDEIEYNKVAANTYQKAVKAGELTAARDAYAGMMGGFYNVAANAEDENDFADIAKNFIIGAAAVSGAKVAYKRIPQVKSTLGSIGRSLDEMVGPREKVNAITVNKRGEKEAIVTKIPGYKMADEAVDAQHVAHRSMMQIGRPMLHALNKITKGDAVEAALSLSHMQRFNEHLIDMKDELWKKRLSKMSKAERADLGIESNSNSIKLSSLDNAKTQSIRSSIDAEINAKYFRRKVVNGKAQIEPNEDILRPWLGGMNEELTNKILGNMSIWMNEGQKLSFDIEKQITRENIRSLQNPTGRIREILDKRQEAVKDFNAKASDEVIDLADQEMLNAAFKFNEANRGLDFYIPIRGDRSLAATQQVTKKLSGNARRMKVRRALASELEESERSFLFRDSTNDFLNNQTLENAEKVITEAEQLFNIVAHEKARNSLNTIQREAIGYVGEVMANTRLHEKYMSRLTNLFKKGLLLGPLSWVKNNYWSNIRQAMSAHGVMAAIDGVSVFNFSGDLQKDIKAMFFKKPGSSPILEMKSYDTDRLVDLGVISADHWQEISKRKDYEELWDWLLTDEQKAKIQQRQGDTKILESVEDALDKMSRILHTQQIGGYIEAKFRAATFLRTEKLLKDTQYDMLAKAFGKDAANSAIEKQAVNITNDVFYDYSKLTYWERTYARKIIPFYSFYKQNAFYQSKALLSPEHTRNIGVLQKMADGRYFSAASEPITGDDKKVLPPYLAQNNVFNFTGKDGKKHVYYSTSDPMSQITQMLSGEFWFEGFMQMLNPMVKSSIEQIGGYDFFRGEKLLPSELTGQTSRGLKYLHSKGYGTIEIFKSINAILNSDENPVWADRNGNPVTDSDYVARIDNIFSWAMAGFVGTPQQLFAAYKKYEMGKRSGFDTVLSLMGPWSETQLIGAQQARYIEEFKKMKENDRLDDVNERINRTNKYRAPVGE